VYRQSKPYVNPKTDTKAPSHGPGSALASDRSTWRSAASPSEKLASDTPKSADTHTSPVPEKRWANSRLGMRAPIELPASAGAGSSDVSTPVFTGLIADYAPHASLIAQEKTHQFKHIISTAIETDFATAKIEAADALIIELKRQDDIGLIETVIAAKAEAIDARVLNLLVEQLGSNYAELSDFILSSASHLLDNDIIITMAENYEIAHALFTKAIDTESASPKTYIAYIKAALKFEEFMVAETVYEAAYSQVEFRTLELFNMRLKMLLATKQWKQIRDLFDSPETHGYEGIKVNTASYVQRIYLEQKIDELSKEIKKVNMHALYNSAVSAGIHNPTLDCRYMGSLASLEVKAADLAIVEKIMRHYDEKSRTAKLYQYANYLLKALANNRSLANRAFELASAYYLKAKETGLINVTHYCDYIDFCQHRNVQQYALAIDAFKDAMSRGVSHDKLYRSLIALARNCSKLKELKDESLAMLAKDVWPELCKSMMMAACNEKDEEFADAIYALMKANPAMATEVTYSIYIQKATSYDKALAAYQCQKDQKLNYSLYRALIIAAIKHRRFLDSVELMKAAAACNQLDELGYQAFIAEAGRAAKIEFARKIYDTAISSAGVCFSENIHFAMIEVYHRHGQFDAALSVFISHFADIIKPEHERNKADGIDFHGFNYGTAYTASRYLFSQGRKWHIIVGKGLHSKTVDPNESPVRCAVRDFMKAQALACVPMFGNNGIFICTKPASEPLLSVPRHVSVHDAAPTSTARVFSSSESGKARAGAGSDCCP